MGGRRTDVELSFYQFGVTRSTRLVPGTNVGGALGFRNLPIPFAVRQTAFLVQQEVIVAAVIERPHVAVTRDDFITGLLAGLAKRNKRMLSLRDSFYVGAMAAFDELQRWSEANGADVNFWLARNPFHGDSPAVRDGITEAVQRDLVSLDNPTYLRMRIKITPRIAERYMKDLPGGVDLYDGLTDTFLKAYSESL